MTGLPMDMVEMIAPEILAHVGADLGIAAPRLASLRAVYRLSPLGFKHMNMLGRYAFTLPDTVARGELRPLRDPNATGIDDA